MPTAIRSLGEAQREQLKALQGETSGHVRSAFTVAQQRAAHSIRTFARAYGGELQRLRSVEDVDGETDARAKVPSTWLHTHGLHDVQATTKASVAVAATYSLHLTQQGKQRAAIDGQHNAHSLIVASAPVTPKPIVQPAIPPKLITHSTYNHAPLVTYFDPLDDLASATVVKVASNAAGSGWLADAMEAALFGVFTSMFYSANTVAVAETTGAYQGMVTLTWRANDELVTGWIRHEMPDACDECVDYDGVEFGLDDDFEQLHPFCRGWQEPIIRYVGSEAA